MEMFEYVAVLTSIIIGLGIAHLLQGVANLIQHPGRYRIYWVHLAWVTYLFFFSIFWWWWEFRLSEIDTWSFQVYMFVIFYAVFIYLVCALLFPRDLSGYDGFEDYFFARRAWFFGLLLLILIVDLGDTWLKGEEYFSSLGIQYLVTRPLRVILYIVAMLTSSRKFHAVLVVLVLLYQIPWALYQYQTIG